MPKEPKPKIKVVYVKEKRKCIRAPGKGQRSISMSEVTLQRGQKLAEMDGRTFSALMARLIEKEWAKMLKDAK